MFKLLFFLTVGDLLYFAVTFAMIRLLTPPQSSERMNAIETAAGVLMIVLSLEFWYVVGWALFRLLWGWL